MRVSILAAIFSVLAANSCDVKKQDAQSPPVEAAENSAGEFRLVGEFEPMAGIWLGADPEDEGLMAVTADLVRALSPGVSVTIVAASEDATASTKSKLEGRGVDIGNVEFLQHEQTQYFIRDSGAVFAVNGAGDIGAVDFKWSAYGLKGWCGRLYPDDAPRAEQCAGYADLGPEVFDRWMGETFGGPVFPVDINLEGGAIETNGRGVVIVSSVLAKQRNPGRTLDELKTELLKLPGVTTVIWLDDGLADDPQMKSTIIGDYVGLGTGGHTDEFVRFADAETILLAWVDEEEAAAHPVSRINRERMMRNLEILEAARDRDGKPFRIVKTPLPRPIEREFALGKDWTSGAEWTADTFPASEGRTAGDKVIHVAAASYLNYVIANEVVVLPTYVEDGADPAEEEKVVALFASVFPGREILRVSATTLNWLGGGLHCISASEPEHGG